MVQQTMNEYKTQAIEMTSHSFCKQRGITYQDTKHAILCVLVPAVKRKETWTRTILTPRPFSFDVTFRVVGFKSHI